MKKLVLVLALLPACATTPEGKLAQTAKVTKVTVDGAGNAYLEFCEEVRRPQCIAEDQAASAAGTPQTREDRVACLKPCDSATAEKIQTAVGALRVAQSGVLAALKAGEDAEKLDKAREGLKAAADELQKLLEETGALDMLEEALMGTFDKVKSRLK